MRTTAAPLRFPLRAGENRVTLTNLSNAGLVLGTLEARAPRTPPGYADYRQAQAPAPLGGDIRINAIDYVRKNSSQLIYQSVNDPALTPNNPAARKLNTLLFTEPGMEAEYRFRVDQAGDYRLALHYRNSRQEMDAFVTVLLDGAIPFAQCVNQPLPDTASRWDNRFLQDARGEPFPSCLEPGEHTLTLRLEAER